MDGQFVVSSSIAAASVVVTAGVPVVGHYLKRRDLRRQQGVAEALAAGPPRAPIPAQLSGILTAERLRILDARLTSDPDDRGQPRLTLAITFSADSGRLALPEPVPPPVPAAAPGPRPAPGRPAELRIPGVDGVPAGTTLGEPLVRRVGGDTDAGFFRPPAAADDASPTVHEAYQWSNLSSGVAARALWGLMLPFQLANLMHWLRPPMARGAALFQALCRLFALGLTMMFVLSICGIWLDLVAWRCATDTGCRARHPGLQAVADGWLAAPGRRLCVAALAPIAVVGFLWWLGRRTWLRYETYQGPATGTGGSGLASGTFWDLRRPVARLRSLHVTTALTSIDVLVLVALLDHTGAPGRFLLAASLLLEATVLGLACRAPGGGVRDVRWMDSVCRAVRTAALALTICVLALSAAVADRFPTVGGMPGYALLVDWLTGAEVALLLVLAAVTLAGRGYAGKVLLGGLGAVLAGSAATGIGSAFGAALYFQVQGFLGLAPGAGVGVVPVFYTWSALGFAVLVIVAALLAGVAQLVTISNLRRQARAFTDADYPDVRRRDLLRAVTIDDAIARAKLTDFVPRLFAVGYAPVAIGGCAAAICAMAGILPTRLLASAPQLADLVAALTTVGRFAVGLMALGLLLLGLLAYRFPWTRRSVGILWDAATFWPRLAHPFGPPCYANRIVNEVAIRSQWMAEGGGLVLSGHGHGALLAIAALLRMDPAPAARTALLTTGAPTRRIFGRLFPAYLDQSLFDLVGTRLATGSGHARWINLWRGTDPVGGPVGEPADDRRIPDPGGAYPLPGDSAYPPIDGNADYDTAPGYRLAVQDLVGALASSRAPG